MNGGQVNTLKLMNKPVSFEIAKLLKEKGFNEPCNQLYFDGELKDITVQKVSYDDTLSSRYYIAPTIAQVVMWLYEKHGVWIEVRKSYLLHQFVAVTKNPRVELSSKDSPTEAYEGAIEYTLKNLI